MEKKKAQAVGVFVFLLLISYLFLLPLQAQAQDKDVLDRAIALYQHQNYEEALELLKGLKAQSPQSSTVAYYLGMTYKQMQDFKEARRHLEAAATLEPVTKNAYIELIDILYQINEMDEAKIWIKLADADQVSPAQAAFFKGLVLLKEGSDPDGAIAAFDNAQRLDEALARTAKYYKALACVQSKRTKEAKYIFREFIATDPNADLSAYAEEYLDAIERAEKVMRPFHYSIGYAVQYDDNVILRPDNSALSEGISDHSDFRQVVSLQGDYNLKPAEHFLTRVSYAGSYTKQADLGFYDMLNHDISLFPAYYTDKHIIGFPMHYNHVILNDKRYLQTAGIGNLNNLLIGDNNMAQLAVQYENKSYKWKPTVSADSKNAQNYLGALGWFYFFDSSREGFVNFRYAFNYEEANGNNWSFYGNRLSAMSTIPLTKKIKWSLAGDFQREDFKKRDSNYDKKRYDNIYTVSNMLTLKFFKDFEFQLQHVFVDDIASIGVFKYRRNIYSIGIRYVF